MAKDCVTRRLLITGAAGEIGTVLRKGLQGHFDFVRLTDIKPMAPAGRGEEIIQADILDPDAMVDAMKDIDCVVHLAGIPCEDNWQNILDANIIGCRNVFEGARIAGVKRVVFASSNHVIGFYHRDQIIDAEVLTRPDTRYGVSKVFGEALGRLYADKYGLSVSCLRIGSFRREPEDQRQLMTWISPGDMVQLAELCIVHPSYHFIIVYGVSNNDRSIWDNSKVEWLGYCPKDNAENFAAAIVSRDHQEDPIARIFHGGSFCSAEFSRSPARIK